LTHSVNRRAITPMPATIFPLRPSVPLCNSLHPPRIPNLNPNPTTNGTPTPKRAYFQALTALSARTGTPLPSLITSFAVLHEITAVVPLVGLFFCARAGGVGERVVDAVRSHTHVDSASGGVGGWAATTAGEWLDEGEKWAARVGRRYGIWGFEKRGSSSSNESHSNPTNHEVGVKVAGDVANAVFAYGLTKALLPARIGLSLYLAPAFSRRAVEPLRLALARMLFRNGNKLGAKGPPAPPPTSSSS